MDPIRHFGVSESFYKVYGDHFCFPAHLHQSFELITPLSGVMELTVDGEPYRLSPGEAVLIFPNQIHTIDERGNTHMICVFAPELVHTFVTETAGRRPVRHDFRPSGRVLEELRELPSDASDMRKKGVLYALCAEFDEQAVYRPQTKDDHNLLCRIFTFVEQNYQKDCTLQSLAREQPYSYAYLSRYFKQAIGVSYNAYVNQYRIGKACSCLRNTGMSIVDCAFEVGYTSLRSFNRNFKLYTALTPQEWRRAQKKRGDT